MPPGWKHARGQRPDTVVAAEAGFESLGAFRFPTDHRWTADDLIGFVYSTSFLPRHALGALAGDFEADLRRALDEVTDGADMWQTVDFAHELFRRPGSPP